MILQALFDYYERKSSDPSTRLAPLGFEWKEIPFIVEINELGRCIQIHDTRYFEGKRPRALPQLVPQDIGRSSNIDANLLWDKASYALGVSATTSPERLELQKAKFIGKVKLLADRIPDEPSLKALDAFLQTDAENDLESYAFRSDILEKDPSIAFRLQGDNKLICQRPTVVAAICEISESEDADEKIVGMCLVTGIEEEVAIKHQKTPILGSKSNAKLVSFNEEAYNSYGKKQGANAPVGKRAAFAYTTALNHLLRRDSLQKLQVGDATTVFWADQDTGLENEFAMFFDEPPKDDPDRGVRAVAALLQAAQQGVGPFMDDKTRFFVLGLAPNAARIAIRFWQVGTVADMVGRILKHFEDINITAPSNPQFLSLSFLLRSTAQPSQKWPGGDPEKIPPNLGGEVMRAILAGLPYPDTLFQGALRRIRAEHDITYPRAAILKACLNRKHDSKEKEMTVSLDKDNTNPGYRLGRLFAVLERVQEEANPGINATIRDRFYGAASSTPAVVFPNLMRLKNHHLAKLENPGRRVNLEKLIGEIVNGLAPAFPPHLSLGDQGRFAIGYYHQRMDKSTYTNQGE